MDGLRTARRCVWALAAGLSLAGTSLAGEQPHLYLHHPGCPRQVYSRLNFLTPALFRVKACLTYNGDYIYAKDHYPEMPLHYQAEIPPCRAVSPAEYPFPPFSLNPPAESPRQ